MRAIITCVDFSDLLAITLPYNRHHFEDVCVVTSVADAPNVAKVVGEVNRLGGKPCSIFITDAFWDDGAAFNKWKALEQGLDVFGRRGWLCLMDADVLWPRSVKVTDCGDDLLIGNGDQELCLESGQLCTPLRRMWDTFPVWPYPDWHKDRLPEVIPDECHWKNLLLHRNVGEWAGYSQIFHADDPVLGPPPWHQIDWRHAGGADSFFQRKWPKERKVRPPFHCLHLGPAGHNWYGRATPRLDGSRHPASDARIEQVNHLWRERARRRREGLDQFANEKTPAEPEPGGGL